MLSGTQGLRALGAPRAKGLWFGPVKKEAPAGQTYHCKPLSVFRDENHKKGAARCHKKHCSVEPLSGALLPAFERLLPEYVTRETGQLGTIHVVDKHLTPAELANLPPVYAPKVSLKKIRAPPPAMKRPGNASERAVSIAEAIRNTHKVGFIETLHHRLENEWRKSAAWEDMYRSSIQHLPINIKTEAPFLKERVSIVSGETGSGKTTQLPQIVLDSILREGREGRVFVTQPRRVAAISIAERVAAERGETLGVSVGYIVSLDAVPAKSPCSITYLTTGSLVRMILNGLDLQDTHVIVDELHERTLDNDFLLFLLRSALRETPSLRVSLMSATISFAPFVSYFEEFSPVVHAFPGRSYPVAEHHVDDPSVPSLKRFIQLAKRHKYEASRPRKNAPIHPARARALSADAPPAGRSQTPLDTTGSARNLMPRLSSVDGKSVTSLLEQGVPESVDANDPPSACAEVVSDCSMSLLEDGDHDFAQLELNLEDVVAEAVAWVIENEGMLGVAGGTGGVLAFVPSIQHVKNTADLIERSHPTALVIRLYGNAPKEEFEKMFSPLPHGLSRKIVVATSVAETSITVPDVTMVVNTGLSREKASDGSASEEGLLRTERCSKAGNKQRAGRAGRVATGAVLHLFPRRLVPTLPEYSVPEIHRTSLTTLLLFIHDLKKKRKESVSSIVQNLIDPPNAAHVASATKMLFELGALRYRNGIARMTRLGAQLVQLKCKPEFGKLLLTAAAFGCIDPVLTIVAMGRYESGRARLLFQNVTAAQKAILQQGEVGSALVFSQLEAELQGRFQNPYQKHLQELRRILAKNLQVLGHLPRSLGDSSGGGTRARLKPADLDSRVVDDILNFSRCPQNRHGGNASVIKAALIVARSGHACLLAKDREVSLPNNCAFTQFTGVAVQKNTPGTFPAIGVFERRLHYESAKGSRRELANVTFVTPNSLVILAPRINAVQHVGEPETTSLVADGWIPISYPTFHAKYLMVLHTFVQQTLRKHLAQDPSFFEYHASQRFFDFVARLLWLDSGEDLASFPQPPDKRLRRIDDLQKVRQQLERQDRTSSGDNEEEEDYDDFNRQLSFIDAKTLVGS
ncbi:DExH-box ATP-dependent RNA helicase DExH1 [Diplonema papillatum]|nr:DExH-box ATP-dependent RNA helicase DExH1 [Diplonema papillatum]|eukprot:gene4440-6881_t